MGATCFGFGLNFSQILNMATEGEGEIITFSVGGTEYTAAKSTLRRAPFFAKMLNPDLGLQPAYKDSKGNFFIDRSPKPFEVLLKFLRTGKVYICEGVSEEELRDEADFYGFEMFIEDKEKEACKEVILLGHDSGPSVGPNPKMNMFKFRIDISGDYKLDIEGEFYYGLADEWASISSHRLQIYNSMGQQQPNGFDRPQYAFPLHEKLLP